MTSFLIMDDGIGARENVIIHDVKAKNLGSYFLYAGPSPSIQNSGIAHCEIYIVMSNHGVRLNGGQYFTIHQTHIDSVERSHVTFRRLKYGQIKQSLFTGKGLYKNSIRNIYDDAALTDSVQYIIYDGNTYISRPDEMGIDLNIGEKILIKNNVFINAPLIVGVNLSGIVPQDVDIWNNTFYQDNFTWIPIIILREGGQGSFKGNLIYAAACESGDCVSSNPFASFSPIHPHQWQIDYNSYFVDGDPSGNTFKGSMSWTTWQSSGFDLHSEYVASSFHQVSTDWHVADFRLSADKALIPRIVHRDKNNQERSSTTNNTFGAFVLGEATSNITTPQDKANFIKLYPNPTEDKISMQFNNVMNTQPHYSIQVWNTQGQIMYALTNFSQPFEISMKDWAPGMYIFSVCNEIGDCQKISVIRY